MRRSKSVRSHSRRCDLFFYFLKSEEVPTLYQALYRKYRPAVFSDVVGQEHITAKLNYEQKKAPDGKTDGPPDEWWFD